MASKKTTNRIPFASGVVGSLPRPVAVQDILPENPGAESLRAARSERMDRAVGYSVTLQEMAGLDLVTDGEWRRHSYTNIIADIADGFTPDPRPGRWGITVTEPMQVRSPGLAAEEARRLLKVTDRMTKVCLPSPYLLGERLWDPEWSVKAYPTRDTFIDALVPILHEELVQVSKTGVDVVQIDEPHLCVLVDPDVRSTFDDPQYEMSLAAAKINEVIHGVDGVQIALHVCRRNWGRRGWGARGGYEPILDTMKSISVDQYVIEFAIPDAGDVAILKELPEDALIGLGSVECRLEHIDTADEIVARVEEAMKYVEPERLSLNPDCGFAPGKASDIPLDEAYLKLRNEAQAARILRDKYA